MSRCSKVLQRKSKTPGKLCDSDSLPSSFLLIFFLLTHRHGHTKWATIIKNLVVVGFSRNVSVRCNLYSSMLSASMAMQWENEGRRQHNGIWKVPISVWPWGVLPFTVQQCRYTALRMRAHTWPHGESFKCCYLSLCIFIWPCRAQHALGEAAKVTQTALLSAFARSVVSLTDAVYCSQQNQ